jgi:hypothetical protein
MLSGNISAESCLLCQTESSTAAGWLKIPNFADKFDEMVQLTTACQLANIMIKTKSCLFSQWFSGELNMVSDFYLKTFTYPQNPCLTSLHFMYCNRHPLF